MNDDRLKLTEFCREAAAWPVLREGETKKNLYTAMRLALLKYQHQDGAPLAALEAVYISFWGGFTVPVWAHQSLAVAFGRFLPIEGESLESVLGNPTAARKRGHVRSRDISVLGTMRSLVVDMRFTVETAAKIVCAMKARTWDLDDREIEFDVELKPNTVIKMWKSYADKEPLAEEELPPDERLEYLKDYLDTIHRLIDEGAFRRPERMKVQKTIQLILEKALANYPHPPAS